MYSLRDFNSENARENVRCMVDVVINQVISLYFVCGHPINSWRRTVVLVSHVDFDCSNCLVNIRLNILFGVYTLFLNPSRKFHESYNTLLSVLKNWFDQTDQIPLNTRWSTVHCNTTRFSNFVWQTSTFNSLESYQGLVPNASGRFSVFAGLKYNKKVVN